MKYITLVLMLNAAACGATLSPPQGHLLGGEISNLTWGRSDAGNYATGMRTLENALVIDIGTATRRPGSVYVATAPGAARLEPFVYSESDIYVMEFTDELLRFYRSNGIVLDGASPYTLTTPWAQADVNDLSLYQKGDVLYVAHEDYSPRKITRADHTDWTLEDCNDLILNGPFRDENEDTSVSIDPPSAPTDLTSGETFDANDTYSTYVAGEAFDDDLGSNDGWIGDETEDTWISCQFAVAQTITRVKIYPCVNTANYDRNPKYCKIEASNDGSAWTKLGVERWYGRCQAYNGDEIEFPDIRTLTDYGQVWLDNETAYTYYRIWIDENWGSASYTGILEIEMTETDSGSFTANDDLFDAEHVGSVWRLRHKVANTAYATIDHETWDEALPIYGDFDFYADNSGNLVGTINIERSEDYGATWSTFRSWVMDSSIDGITTKSYTEEELGIQYRVSVTDRSSGNIRYGLSAANGTKTGIIQITGYIDANEVTATILEPLGDTTATYLWSEGAWSDYRSYPAAVAGHAGRLVFARDLTVWWSGVPDLENFAPGETDDSAFTFTLAQSRQSPIQWLVGDKGQSLLCGSLGRIIELRPTDELTGFTASNYPKVSSSTAVGSSSVKPVIADNAVLYVSGDGTRLHELLYDDNQGSVLAPDITAYASHIFGDGATQLALQKSPYPYIWATRDDGQIATCYYNRPYGIVSWSRQVTDGKYTSVAVVPSAGAWDQVWTVVRRVIDSNAVYYVEYFKDLHVESEIQDGYYLDSALSSDLGAAVTIAGITKANPGVVTVSSWNTNITDGAQIWIEDVTGMTEINDRAYTIDDANESGLTFSLDGVVSGSNWNTSSYTSYSSGGTATVVEDTYGGASHLEAETACALADGLYYDDVDVDSGAFTLSDYANTVVVGLAYTSTIEPVEFNVYAQGVNTAPLNKRLVGLYADFYRSYGGRYGLDADHLTRIPEAPSLTRSAVPNLTTGGVVLDPVGGTIREARYRIVQDEAYPFTIRALIPQWETR